MKTRSLSAAPILLLAGLACSTIAPTSLGQAGTAQPATEPAAQPAQAAPVGDERAIARLTDAQGALDEIATISWDVSSYMLGIDGKKFGYSVDVDGTVRAARTDQGWARNISGEMGAFLGRPAEKFLVFRNGNFDVSFVDDENAKLVYTSARPGQSVRNAAPVSNADLASLNEFFTGGYRRLTNLNPQMESPREVNGEMCDVIMTTNGQTQRRWLIAQSDHMPRRIEELAPPLPEGKEPSEFNFSMRVHDITNIKLNEAITADELRLTEPSGYTSEYRGRRSRENPAIDAVDSTLDNSPAGPRPDPNAIPSSLRVGTEAGNIAPAIRLKSVDGEDINLGDFRGSTTVLYFWSTWAPKTDAASAEIAALVEDLDQDVKVLSVAFRERIPASAAERLAKNGHDFILAIDDDRASRDYEVRRVPAIFVIDDKGRITFAGREYEEGTTITEARKAIEAIGG